MVPSGCWDLLFIAVFKVTEIKRRYGLNCRACAEGPGYFIMEFCKSTTKHRLKRKSVPMDVIYSFVYCHTMNTASVYMSINRARHKGNVLCTTEYCSAIENKFLSFVLA